MAVARTKASKGDQASTKSPVRQTALKKGPVAASDISGARPRQVREKRKKKMFSLRIETSAIEWWQSQGKGYTGIMARLLEAAKTHPEWIKQSL